MTAPRPGDAGLQTGCLRVVGLLASEMSSLGGIQTFMLRIAEVLARAVQQSDVRAAYCLTLNDTAEELRAHPQVPDNIHVWGASGVKWRFVAHCLARLPKTETLFVGHLGLAPVAQLLKKLGRVERYYVILHGIEAWREVDKLDRLALLAADGVIATTRFTVHECATRNSLPLQRFKIIPLCVDQHVGQPSPSFRLNGGFKLLCVARQDRAERYKGFEQIFEAIVRVRASHPEIHLNLVGRGDDQHRLKQAAASLGVADQVTFWGALSSAELAAAYRDCDVFVMPSRKEGFGIVFLEAMRFGKPCIGGNHGGTPEVISHGETGFLVDYGDVPALARRLAQLVDDPATGAALGARGRDVLQQQYAFPMFESRYRDVFLRQPVNGDEQR